MSEMLGNIKDAELKGYHHIKELLFNAKFGHMLKHAATDFAGRIPVKYHKIITIVSGTLVAASPLVLKYVRKRQWIFYVLIGAAEIFSSIFTEKEKEQRTVIYTAL